MTGTRIWALGTAVVIVAVLALGWLLGVSPMLTRLSAAEAELSSTVANNEAQQSTLQVMKAQFEDLDALQGDLAALRVAIPGVVDPEFVYGVLAQYQAMTQANVTGITTGEPQPYGLTVEGLPTADGVTAIPNLYTVPVTVTFTNAPALNVIAYAAAMQRGPRLFLVTSITGTGAGEGEQTATITAYMFVLADPEAEPTDATEALLAHPFDQALFAQPLGKKPAGAATPTPTPTESDAPAAPDTEASPTPTPTP